eukprot:5220729-Pleurochrysis_carterae.AAC.2
MDRPRPSVTTSWKEVPCMPLSTADKNSVKRTSAIACSPSWDGAAGFSSSAVWLLSSWFSGPPPWSGPLDARAGTVIPLERPIHEADRLDSRRNLSGIHGPATYSLTLSGSHGPDASGGLGSSGMREVAKVPPLPCGAHNSVLGSANFANSPVVSAMHAWAPVRRRC